MRGGVEDQEEVFAEGVPACAQHRRKGPEVKEDDCETGQVRKEKMPGQHGTGTKQRYCTELTRSVFVGGGGVFFVFF